MFSPLGIRDENAAMALAGYGILQEVEEGQPGWATDSYILTEYGVGFISHKVEAIKAEEARKEAEREALNQAKREAWQNLITAFNPFCVALKEEIRNHLETLVEENGFDDGFKFPEHNDDGLKIVEHNIVVSCKGIIITLKHPSYWADVADVRREFNFGDLKTEVQYGAGGYSQGVDSLEAAKIKGQGLVLATLLGKFIEENIDWNEYKKWYKKYLEANSPKLAA
jgi:hypothetical protein